MSIFTPRPVLRWMVPVAVFVAMIGGGATARTPTASAQTPSPSRPSPAQLLTDVQNSRNQPVSGTVVERADLGLPAQLTSDSGSSNLRSLLSGSHTLRVWYAGPTQSRIALIGTLGETDIIRNGKDLWVWNSQKNTATHKTLRYGGATQSPSAGQTPSPTQTSGPGTTTGMTQSPSASPSGVAYVATPRPSPSSKTAHPSPSTKTAHPSPSRVAYVATPRPSPSSKTAHPHGSATSRAAMIETPSPSGTMSPGETPSMILTPSPTGAPSATASAMTPQEISNRIISKLEPYTYIRTTGPIKVASRTANELVLVPRDTRSLVARVTMAVDSQRHVPLRVRIFARNYANPAFETAFTQINFTPPNPAQFNFTPPPGATVKEAKPHHARPAMQPPVVVGKGWTSVIIAKVPPQATTRPQPASPPMTSGPSTESPSVGTASPPTGTATGTAQPGAAPTGTASASPGGGLQIENLPRVSGTWGSGHLLSSRLFNILFTDDGRVLAGAVPPQMLYAAAAQK